MARTYAVEPSERRQLSLTLPTGPGDDSPGWVEQWARARGLLRLVGVDEVGRGPLAGPVVAAAVMLPPEHGIEGLDDSKRLCADRREELSREVHRRAVGVGLAEVCATTIDRVNILQAALRAMCLAVCSVRARCGPPQLVLVDGITPLPLQVPQRTVVGGDHLSENIAAASIVAKVHRDRLMATLDGCWPGYAFHTNMGYATKAHRAALRRLGPCPIHRRSFNGAG